MVECRLKAPVLFYASLYPGDWNPTHGLFVYELRRALRKLGEVPVVVPENGFRKRMAPEPSFPFKGEGEEVVFRKEFWTVPKVAKAWDGALMALWTRSTFGRALEYRPWLVHAHYAFPEAAAAADLAEEADLPLVVTVHGSDINVLAEYAERRELIINALTKADAVVAVSRALQEKVCELGVPSHKVFHIPNGVALDRFSPGSRQESRAALELSVDGLLLMAVGRLEDVKGYDLLLQAIAGLEGVSLAFAGDGSRREALERQAAELGIADRVFFLGMVAHDQLAACYRAADLMVMSSHSEGWPTVVFESFACGTPVVAPAVGGIPEILHSPQLGRIADSNSPDDLAGAIGAALNTEWDAALLQEEAARHSWDAIACRYIEVYWRVG